MGPPKEKKKRQGGGKGNPELLIKHLALGRWLPSRSEEFVLMSHKLGPPEALGREQLGFLGNNGIPRLAPPRPGEEGRGYGEN